MQHINSGYRLIFAVRKITSGSVAIPTVCATPFGFGHWGSLPECNAMASLWNYKYLTWTCKLLINMRMRNKFPRSFFLPVQCNFVAKHMGPGWFCTIWPAPAGRSLWWSQLCNPGMDSNGLKLQESCTLQAIPATPGLLPLLRRTVCANGKKQQWPVRMVCGYTSDNRPLTSPSVCWQAQGGYFSGVCSFYLDSREAG